MADYLKYGRTKISLPPALLNRAEFLLPQNPPPPLTDTFGYISRKLQDPTGSLPLGDRVKPGQKVVVVVSDISRPAPNRLILLPVLSVLERAGVSDITILFALGNHRPMTEGEMRDSVGPDIFASYRTAQPSDFRSLGYTSRGTPLEFDRRVLEADFLVLTGNLEFHYFMGYSGGFKALMPGVSTNAAISVNHRLMFEPKSSAGIIEGNTARADIEECAAFFDNCFLLNVLLDSERRILDAVTGDPILAHREGAALIDRYYKVYPRQKGAAVIASAGGYPKDINLYQAQKALENAVLAVGEGAPIILVAEAAEGFGEAEFENLMLRAGSPEEIIREIRAAFRLGAHKAALYAQVMRRNPVYLVSSLDEDTARRAFFVPLAKDRIESVIPPAGHLIIMPFASQTVPQATGREGV